MATAKYKKNKRGEFEARIWDGTYNPDGSKHRKKIVSKKSSADLERKVSEFKQTVSDACNTVYSDIMFGEYAEHWVSVAKSSRAEKTKDMYDDVINRNLSSLHNVRVCDLRHSHFQQVINLYIDHPRTCEQISMTFKQIVKAAVRDRILPRIALEDILEGISLPNYEKAEKRALTVLERDAIFSAEMDDRKTAFLFTLYYTGIRKSEALALSRFDFDFKSMTVNINKALVFAHKGSVLKTPKSKNGTRKVPIPNAMIDKVKTFVESSDGGFLWRTRYGEMMTESGYQRMWQSIIMSLNIALGYKPFSKKDKGIKQITDLTAHILRHNWCTEMCYQVPKVTTKMIAKIFGDNEKMVLEIYSHIKDEKESTADAVNNAFAV